MLTYTSHVPEASALKNGHIQADGYGERLIFPLLLPPREDKHKNKEGVHQYQGAWRRSSVIHIEHEHT